MRRRKQSLILPTAERLYKCRKRKCIQQAAIIDKQNSLPKNQSILCHHNQCRTRRTKTNNRLKESNKGTLPLDPIR